MAICTGGPVDPEDVKPVRGLRKVGTAPGTTRPRCRKRPAGSRRRSRGEGPGAAHLDVRAVRERILGCGTCAPVASRARMWRAAPAARARRPGPRPGRRRGGPGARRRGRAGTGPRRSRSSTPGRRTTAAVERDFDSAAGAAPPQPVGRGARARTCCSQGAGVERRTVERAARCGRPVPRCRPRFGSTGFWAQADGAREVIRGIGPEPTRAPGAAANGVGERHVVAGHLEVGSRRRGIPHDSPGRITARRITRARSGS